MMAKMLLVFLAFAIVVYVESFGPKAGPYDLDIEKVENCEKQGSGKVVFGTRITNAGKGKYLYKENFTIGVPGDENFKVYTEVQRWGNGGWRPKFLEHKLKNCEEIWKVLGDFLKSLMKSSGHNVEKCPMPAGSYKADDWMIEANLEKTVPVMEYGKYRGILQFYYKDELVGCITIYGEVKAKAFG